MLKQCPNKNLRSKGFKVKNVLQICVLLVICLWFLHQVKHSYDEKKAFQEDAATFSEMQSELGSIKLGRKDLHVPVQESDLENDRNRERAFEKLVENKNDEIEDEGRGGGDDEIDGHDQDKPEDEESEEVEDLIDEEDREREDGSEDQENEEMGNQFEDESLSLDQAQYEGKIHSEASEERYTGDDAARALMQDRHAMRTEFPLSGLRKLMEEPVENIENIQLEPGV